MDLAPLPDAPSDLPRLAPRPDLDRRQRLDRRVVQPVDLPVLGAEPGLPGPGPPPGLQRRSRSRSRPSWSGCCSAPDCSTGATSSRASGGRRSSSTGSAAGHSSPSAASRSTMAACCRSRCRSSRVVGVAFGLFVLAGATPAALGLLADISEQFPTDRGAIMGLYSVFLAVGQIAGSLIGGRRGRLARLRRPAAGNLRAARDRDRAAHAAPSPGALRRRTRIARRRITEGAE